MRALLPRERSLALAMHVDQLWCMVWTRPARYDRLGGAHGGARSFRWPRIADRRAQRRPRRRVWADLRRRVGWRPCARADPPTDAQRATGML